MSDSHAAPGAEADEDIQSVTQSVKALHVDTSKHLPPPSYNPKNFFLNDWGELVSFDDFDMSKPHPPPGVDAEAGIQTVMQSGASRRRAIELLNFCKWDISFSAQMARKYPSKYY